MASRSSGRALPSGVTLGVRHDALHIPTQAVGPRLPVARQPIWTTEGTLVGHEYLYRSEAGLAVGVDGWTSAEQEVASASVLASIFAAGAPAGDDLVFVNVTRSFLACERALPNPDGRLVLEVVESVAADDGVLAGLPELRAAGYGIALDDYVASADQVAMLPFADYVKVDLRDLDSLPVVTLAGARRYGARLVAEYVADRELVERAVGLGFDLLQGDELGAAAT